MEKKIGILTFHFPDNYGAVLQSYSLYRKISSMGYDVELIDYVPESNAAKKGLFVRITSIKTFLSNIIRLSAYPLWLKRKNHFKRFRDVFFRMSDRYSGIGDVPYENYEMIVTGSDQTFNRNYGFTDVYFQPFNKSNNQKKIAYAPSFGSMSLSLLHEDDIAKLRDFDSISCREVDAASALSSLLNRNVPVVFDPVFLTKKDEWMQFVDKTYKRNPYVFVYDLNARDNVLKIARERFPDYEIVMYSNDPLGTVKMRGRGISFVQGASVEDFLTLIYHSDAVVTDSFHGTAFSLIMEKDFYVYISLEKAAGRITSLLECVGLRDRIVTIGNYFSPMPIDYSVVRERIERYIDKSESFLIEALDEK